MALRPEPMRVGPVPAINLVGFSFGVQVAACLGWRMPGIGYSTNRHTPRTSYYWAGWNKKHV